MDGQNSSSPATEIAESMVAKTPTKPRTPPPCMNCRKRPSEPGRRGDCNACYQALHAAWRDPASGVTEAISIQMGTILPSRRGNRNCFTSRADIIAAAKAFQAKAVRRRAARPPTGKPR